MAKRKESSMTTTKKLIKARKKETRLRRLAKHLGISVGLMAGANVETEVRDKLRFPAATERIQYTMPKWMKSSWYSGTNTKFSRRFKITFSASALGDDLALWLGAAWHELGHVLWSPFGSKVQHTTGLNLLEDARIETLLLQKYPKVRGSLMAILRYLLADITDEPVFGYAFVAGRTHLSAVDRNRFRSLLPEHIADEIDRIFREYLSMGSKMNIDKGTRLAEELNRLLGEHGQGHGSATSCSSTMINMGEALEDDGSTPIPSDVIDEIGGSASKGGSLNNDTAEGSVANKRKTQTAKRDVADSIRDDMNNDQALKDEISKLEKYLEGVGGMYGQRGNTETRTPTPDAKKLAQEVRRVAAKFNDESGKGLVRRRDSGRLRPMRYEKFGDLNSAYDMWEPGLDQEMYVGLVVDISGSMINSPVNRVYYALDRGLSDVATVETVFFNAGYCTPHDTNTDTRQIRVRPSGGTNPTEALAYIHSRLESAPQVNKLLVIYTDGHWNDDVAYGESALFMEDLKKQGIHIRLVGERDGADFRSLQKHMPFLEPHELVTADSISELPNVVLGWTKNVLTKGEY